MKKRILALMMVTAMSVSLLAGCGNQPANNSSSESKATESATTSEATSESATVEENIIKPLSDKTIVVEVNVASGNDTEFYMERIDAFNDGIGKDYNVEIKAVEMDSTGLSLAIEGGTEPDIFSSSKIQADMENGVLAAWDDIPELADFVAKFCTVENTNTVYEGKYYRFPMVARLYGIAYNKDMFKAAGLVDEKGEAKPPATWEEVVEYAKVLTDPDKRQYGIIYPGKWSSWFGSEIGPAAVSVMGRNKWDYVNGQYDYSIYKPIMEVILQMDDNGSVYPGTDGLDNDSARAIFAEGNIGMKFSVSWDVGVWNEQFPANCDWGVFPYPTIGDTEYYHQAGVTYSPSISKRGVEEHGTAAIALVYEYMYGEESQAEQYRRGLIIPWSSEVIEAAGEVNEGLVGWADYGKIMAKSDMVLGNHPTDTAGAVNDNNSFVAQVWSREYTIDQWIEERNQIYNDAVKRYKDGNPDADVSEYYNADVSRVIPK